jgi:hypothetical protein
MSWFRRKRKSDASQLLKREVTDCTRQISEKWVYFTKTLKFKETVSLAEQIDVFVVPIQEFVEAKYPLLMAEPINIFWTMLFTAILQSKTHSSDEVNAAITELDKKYGS